MSYSSRSSGYLTKSFSYCVNSKGDDVQILIEDTESTGGETSHDHEHEEGHDHGSGAVEGDADEAGGVHCHEHAGVP